MIDVYPRYAELLADRSGPYTVDDLRDLQVWHKLAWIDPFYLDSDARVRSLIERGRGFTEADKAVLRQVELEILNRVVPEYRDALATRAKSRSRRRRFTTRSFRCCATRTST